MMMTKRTIEIDFLRGVAMLMMAMFHLLFDLDHFRFVELTFTSGPLKIWQLSILSTFVLVSGMSLYMAYSKTVVWQKLLKRLLILGASATLISVATMFVFPKSWIYFGVIHFMVVATLLTLPFVFYPRIALFVGVAIILCYQVGVLDTKALYLWLKEPLQLPGRSEDLVRLFPWIGVMLLGVYIASKELFSLYIVENKVTHAVAKLGQHSLLFYLTHQVVLFGTAMGIYNLLK